MQADNMKGLRENDDTWLHETTLGGKRKDFLWKIDDECNIHIKRVFNLMGENKEIVKIVSIDDLNRLNEYMGDGNWKDLANNVEKLANGKEKEGIGKFLYKKLKWSTTDAQLSGHLGVIFYLSGVWDYNGKMRGMRFRGISNNWYELVKSFYENYRE